MAANNNTSRSVDHAAPLMRHLSNYAQELLMIMSHIDSEATNRFMKNEMRRVVFKETETK